MKYSLDTYRLYQSESRFSYAVRIRVAMKEDVDISTLQKSVNTAIKRYPYFAVKVVLGEDGGYRLIHNEKEIAVITPQKIIPFLGSEEINEHLLFVECDGNIINFYISHTLAGGVGFMPWVMTSVWQYVSDQYKITPDAPAIRKPGSVLLSDENKEPTPEMLSKQRPVYQYKSKNPAIMKADYMNGLLNPFKRNQNFRIFTLEQSELVAVSDRIGASVASVVMIAMAKAMDSLLPEKHRIIGGETAHNPLPFLGLPNSRIDMLSHIHVDYDREDLKDIKKAGVLTREQFTLQTEPSVSNAEIKKLFELYEQIDGIFGLKNKRKYMAAHNPSSGKDAQHGTFLVNYTGRLDWGEVADYIESYVIIVEGHLTLEMTSMADKLFISFMQLLNVDKYANAFQQALEEMEIHAKVEGPFPKRLSRHELPVK